MTKYVFLSLLIYFFIFTINATTLVNENIQTWTNHASYGSYTQVISAGTMTMTQCIVNNASAANGTCSAGRVQLNQTSGILLLPQLSSIGTAEFHLAAGTTGKTIKLQKYSASTWTDVTTFTSIGPTGATYTYSLNLTTATLIRLSSPNAVIYVHDIIITDYIKSINVTGSFTPFTTTQLTPSASQFVTVSGTNLSANINVAALTGYEYSTDNTNWSSTLSLASSYSSPVYVRLTGATVGSPSGNVSFTSTGATQVDKAVSGTVNPNPMIINITGSFSPFATTTLTPSTSQSVAVSGTNLTSAINVASVSGYSYSTTNTSPWTSSLSLSASFNGNVYVHLTGAAQGTYTGTVIFSSTGANSVSLNVSGTVIPAGTENPISLAGLIVGDLDNYYAPNASGPLNIPAYVQFSGVNEVVHPDVVYIANGWNGYKYWMVFTPYPGSDDTLENPSIVASNDNVTWVVPPGLTNPIDSYASTVDDYYSDPDLILSPDQLTMSVIWRRHSNAYEKLYLRTSTNGINWGTRTEIISSDATDETVISPAVVYNGSQYLLWTVDNKVSPRVIRLRTANSLSGPWSSSTPTNIVPFTYASPNTETWHINVTKVGTEYWMITNDSVIGSSNGLNLLLGKSTDGIHWTFGTHVLLVRRDNSSYWDQNLYRASMIPVSDGQQLGLRIWFSVMRKGTSTTVPWRIGYTEAWCTPRNTRLQAGTGNNVTFAWDGFVSVYQKTTTYKVQQTSTPEIEASWQDATSWSSNLNYTFMRNAYQKRFFRVKAKVE
jgi:hypothetical protein